MITHVKDTAVIHGPGAEVHLILSPEISQTKEMTLIRVEMAPGVPSDAHAHETTEFIYVISGQADWVVEGERSPIAEGSVVIAEAGVSHQIVNTGDTPLLFTSTYVPPLPQAFIERMQKMAADQARGR